MKDMVADVNAKAIDQWTALHFAAENGHYNIVKELLEKHPTAEVDPFSTICRTPLHLAAIKNHVKIA